MKDNEFQVVSLVLTLVISLLVSLKLIKKYKMRFCGLIIEVSPDKEMEEFIQMIEKKELKHDVNKQLKSDLIKTARQLSHRSAP